MLQPRLYFGVGDNMGRNTVKFWMYAGAAILLFSTFASCQDDVNIDQLEASRIKRESVPENRDLTVLLVNDQNRNEYNTKTGRYHNVKPLIGLLTSTARTFIQDGVTTEFATQILGTTLDNGRIYAQLLTKSSLVLYNKPKPEDDPVQVRPTRLPNVFDGQWNVKQDLGFIDPEKFVLKNTDYLAPSSKMDLVYASKPTADNIKYWNSPTAPENPLDNQIIEEPTGRRVQPVNEIPRYVQNEAFNFLDSPVYEGEKKFEFIKPSIIENVNTLHRQSKAFEPVADSIQVDSQIKETLNESLNIVKVKPTHDLPTFTIKNEFSPIFYYIDNVESRDPQQAQFQQTKTPKKLFGQKSEPRPKKTFTYAGFADFTTVVGDTVIIFSPNTEISSPQNPNEVNVFPSAKRVDKLATKITHLSADIPVATSTFKAHESNSATSVVQSSSKENKNRDELQKVHYQIDDDSIGIQYNNGFNLNLDVIQPSEATLTTTESTRYTGDLEVVPLPESSSQATEPLNVPTPSSTVTEKSSAVTEPDISEMFTNSEEEEENTAAEVTEKPESEVDGEHESTAEEIFTTTESGHSEESFENFETTTEIKYDQHEEIYCSDGLETLSTTTTAFKTLTYLTTYFIPEETETTTSVKSDVVVESSVGYLTNVVCKTSSIEPTRVISVEIETSALSEIQSSKEIHNEQASIVLTPIDLVKESIVTQEEKPLEDSIKTPEVFEDTLTISNESESKKESQEQSTTTTEHMTTTNSHVEVSVSTEKSTTPLEKPSPELVDDNPEIQENEIDLIYKTLYTTYTYFTTFFGEHTSSVESHKSVVTNIITSTVDLSQLDPSLLGAFDEDEIAPTNVGIGRPTETFAINSIIDLVKNKDVIESVESGDLYSSQTPTPSLGDDFSSFIKPDAVKTYFTTYTFFTTIYVGADANVCSRNEVYTNYVGPEELIPTKSVTVQNTKPQFDFRNCKQVKNYAPPTTEDSSLVESSISMERSEDHNKDLLEKDKLQPSSLEVDMLFSVESNPLESENSYVTDVKSSSSKGERKFLDNNNVLDDQISSESNIDEIMPSPTLLLQTSYTTFTYFTTMYIGKDSSKVKSRLETITNVVTETISPKKEVEEESNLPITYYTTFTYWTTLYKDKSTTITSREEVVSNVVTPVHQVVPTVSPINITPIDIETELPPKDLEIALKPSDTLEQDDGKATFYTTYTYFTTFYAGNTSHIRSSLETVTNIVENTKVLDDNQLARKVQSGSVNNNLIGDQGEKPKIVPTLVKEEIKATKLPDLEASSPTVLLGTYIDNLFAEVKPNEESTPKPEAEQKIIFSQVAVITGDSTVVTSDNKTLENNNSNSSSTTSTTATTPSDENIISSSPNIIESSVADPEINTESNDAKSDVDDDNDNSNFRKKGRLTFTTKKPSFTPVIIPFASRNRPTFSPKKAPSPSSATTITRADITTTITATPTLKSIRPTGFGGSSRKQQNSFSSAGSSSRRFAGRNSAAPNSPSFNTPSAARSSGFGRGSIQPTSRRTGFRSSSVRGSSLDYISRSAAVPRIRPTASSRLRGGRQSVSVSLPSLDQNESETFATQPEEFATDPIEEITEAPVKTTNNPLSRFRRPPIARQPGTALTSRATSTTRRTTPARGGRVSTTTRRSTTRPTTNPILSLRRQRPNALFPRRNLLRQPEPQQEEEIKQDEQKVEDSEEILDEEEDFGDDNDYDASNRKEQKVSTPATSAPPRRNNIVSIKPFAFRRRTKRQVDYGSRKYSNFRRPTLKSVTQRHPEPEPETETPAPLAQRRNSARFNTRTPINTRTTTAASSRASSRQPFIIRGESRLTTTASPAYRRGKTRPSSRTTTISSRPKAPRLQSDRSRPSTSRTTGRSSRTRTTTSRGTSRQKGSYENTSGEKNFNHLLNDGKITITHHIPTEVTIPVVNGKHTEYKNVLTAKPSLETLLLNQVSTSINSLGIQQLVLASEATELTENGGTKVIRFLLQETPTTTVVFTPTKIRGHATSFAHILPSTVYNVEPVTQTVAPEISSNVPLANLLLSQLLLGNQQPAINPLLALQGQGLLPQQPVVQTPVTEFKTRTTTYVTTVTDARETVLPITFRGIRILTTIVDPTTNVITATEFVTDTVVTTPTAYGQPQQLNSLLLPFLLQQQQQQQQQQQALQLQTANPLLGLSQNDLRLVQNNNFNNDIYSNSPKPNILSDLSSNEDFSEDDQQDIVEETPAPPPKHRTRNKVKPAKVAPAKHTSIVTLYVSGRFPGEFSTVLSTIVSDDTQSVRKREAIYFEDVKVLPSILPSVDELLGSQIDNNLENSIVSDNDVSSRTEIETESLESIVGELSRHIKYDASPTYVVKLANPSLVTDTRQSLVDDVS